MTDGSLQVKFNDYIEEFKKQSTSLKQEEVINSLKELLTILDVLCQKEGIVVEYLKSKEIDDLQNKVVSEDDFLEGCIVYVENVKNIISQYIMVKEGI